MAYALCRAAECSQSPRADFTNLFVYFCRLHAVAIVNLTLVFRPKCLIRGAEVDDGAWKDGTIRISTLTIAPQAKRYSITQPAAEIR
jgi:hypothetical protein